MIENQKSNLTKGYKIAAIFMGLCKAFITFDNSLLIAKLRIYEKLPNKQKTEM